MEIGSEEFCNEVASGSLALRMTKFKLEMDAQILEGRDEDVAEGDDLSNT